MKTESEYHTLADGVLQAMADALEGADQSGAIEAELEGVVLTIALPSGKHYLVSKHAPTRQIWVSSPISGGLHFVYDEGAKQWQLGDGRMLQALVQTELKTLANIEVQF